MIKTKELKIYIESTEDFKRKLKEELKEIGIGNNDHLKEDSISFQSLDQFRRMLTHKRLELLRTIKRQKPGSLYELSKMVNRSPENVTSDISLLKKLGFIKLTKINDARKKVMPEVNYDKLNFEISV